MVAVHKPPGSSWRRIRFADMTDGQERAGHEGCPPPPLPHRPPWSRSTDESEKAMVYIELNQTADVLTCCYAAL
ncbi:predicted protein [Streptomyces sp. C]|nr:predicted protein [Streptomyces sp. C]